ncbi:MAG: hypothetical protein ACREL2_04685 [Gemmatimonadales bacterium]
MSGARVLLVVGLVGIAACASAPSGSFNAPIVGTWDYAATQVSPTGATITGTLKVDNQSGGNFAGSLSLTLTPTGGSPQTMSGPLTGQSVSATAVEFDACLDGCTVPWTHLGLITGDSLVGSWAQQGGPSGNFRAHRTAP